MMKEKQKKWEWWNEPEYAKYIIDGSQDFWLPPEYVDPAKLKPRRLDPDEYDAMHTALDSIRKQVEQLSPENVGQLVGAINLTPATEASKEVQLAKTNPSPPPIYRTRPDGDYWACHDCKDRGDKWYMQDHHCSHSKPIFSV